MSNWKFKKIEKYICRPIHYFITFLGENSNVNSTAMPLFLLLSSIYRYSWLITFEIFRNYYFLDRGVGGWVGCIVSKLVLDFCIFFIFTRPLTPQAIMRLTSIHG